MSIDPGRDLYRHHDRWRPYEDALLLSPPPALLHGPNARRHRGKPDLRAIARRLGRTYYSVKNRRKFLLFITSSEESE